MASTGPTELTQKSGSPGKSRSDTAGGLARRLASAAVRRLAGSAAQPAVVPITAATPAVAAAPRNVRRCSPSPVTFTPVPARHRCRITQRYREHTPAGQPTPDPPCRPQRGWSYGHPAGSKPVSSPMARAGTEEARALTWGSRRPRRWHRLRRALRPSWQDEDGQEQAAPGPAQGRDRGTQGAPVTQAAERRRARTRWKEHDVSSPAPPARPAAPETSAATSTP